MPTPTHQLGLYLHLAQASQRRNRPHVRDRLIILAGVIAARLELYPIAAYCRHIVINHNPGHMIRRWESFSEALEDSDFLHLLKQLQRRYPQEKAERMLSSLEIDMARERETYYSDSEYAAALLGTTEQELVEMFGQSGK